jgi:predicted XRE-type DNA-binding protein
MNLKVTYMITVIVATLLVGSLLSNVALATDGSNSGLVSILNQSKQAAQDKMMQLQDAGINATADVQSQYSQGLAEYQVALDSLNNNTSAGKTHAFHAMELFKNVIEASQQNLVASQSNDASILLQNIADSETYAKKIRVIALANGISANFSDYYKAIKLATVFVAKNDLNSANEQLSTAQDLLDKIYSQIETQAVSTQQGRVTQFLKDTQTTLSKMIDNAKSLGLSQSTIDTLQATLDKLQNAKSTEDILNTTNQTGSLQNVADQYNDQRIVNFQKESARIQHEVGVLQASADKINIQFLGFTQIIQLLDGIKQKIANGQTDEASQELDQVDSLLENMNDVVNGAPELIQQITNAKTLASSLQNQAQGNQNLLDNMGQAVQMLDSAHSMIVNATSGSDLDSSKETISQALGFLNDIKDSLNPNPQDNTTPQNPPENSTQSQNQQDNSTSNSNSTQNPS